MNFGLLWQIENAFSGSKKFFQMELETKRKYQKIYNEMKHGWIDIGQELYVTIKNPYLLDTAWPSKGKLITSAFPHFQNEGQYRVP